MKTAYISHRDCHLHNTGEGHPENARRLTAIEDRLVATGLFDLLRYYDAPLASDEQLSRVHTPQHVQAMIATIPDRGFTRLDPDTVISPESLTAARRAAGAAVLGVDLVMSGEMENAFCCVRPPGHHAESDQAMGFCMFNNIAVGAAHALVAHGIGRAAIVDFDVHQGNGSEEMFSDEPRIMFCSTFQHPFFPYTRIYENAENRVNVPLDASAKSEEFRAAITQQWLPALERFAPEFLFISAGFDAHRDDDMSYVSLTDQDFRWVSEQLVGVAKKTAQGRIVSVLEGGYELDSLARCVEAHLRVLMDLH